MVGQKVSAPHFYSYDIKDTSADKWYFDIREQSYVIKLFALL